MKTQHDVNHAAAARAQQAYEAQSKATWALKNAAGILTLDLKLGQYNAFNDQRWYVEIIWYGGVSQTIAIADGTPASEVGRIVFEALESGYAERP
jgi:hypothetical protein